MEKKIICFDMLTKIVTCCFLGIHLVGQSENLDLSFGKTGFITTGFNTSDDVAWNIIQQQDGKLVVGGSSFGDFALIRLNLDGTLDSTFGINGKIKTDVNGPNDLCWLLDIDQEGKIIAGGYTDGLCSTSFAIVRYQTNGLIDSAFGQNGIVFTDIGNSDDRMWGLKLQADGKIICSGYSYQDSIQYYNFSLVRYNPDGSLDKSFGSNGIVSTDLGNTNDFGHCLEIQKDGKILIAGKSNGKATILRYQINGTLDNDFGIGGITYIEYLGIDSDDCYSLYCQSDGRIIVVNAKQKILTISRLTPNGNYDMDFGVNGQIIEESNINSIAKNVIVQQNGKLLICRSDLFNFQFLQLNLVQYKSDGSLDSNFGENGKLKISDSTFSFWPNAMTVQKDNKIVIVGKTHYLIDQMFICRVKDPLTSYNENIYESQLTIFPNPTSESITINTVNPFTGVCSITDMSCRILMNQQIKSANSITMDVSRFPPGMYLCTCMDEQGNVETKKWVKMD